MDEDSSYVEPDPQEQIPGMVRKPSVKAATAWLPGGNWGREKAGGRGSDVGLFRLLAVDTVTTHVASPFCLRLFFCLPPAALDQ